MRASMLRCVRESLNIGSLSHLLRRSFPSEAVPDRKVAMLGAAGGIGHPLAPPVKLNPLVSKLALYDIPATPGVAADVSHINTRSEALVNMIRNPVNSTVPIADEVFKKARAYDDKSLGVTTLDLIRAKALNASMAKVQAKEDVNVPVDGGGHAGITILPLFSQVSPKSTDSSGGHIKDLTRTQDGGTEAVEVKAGKGSATLPMAYAGALIADPSLNGLNGVPEVVEYSSAAIASVPAALAVPLPILFALWHINAGIKEIMADYVHQEMTRTWILVCLRLFLLIVAKDVFIFLAC